MRGSLIRAIVAIVVVAGAAVTGSAPSGASASLPPTLSGETVILYNPQADGSFVADCNPSGISTLTYDTALPKPYAELQFLPDIGYFDPDPNPINPLPLPYEGPVDLQVQATVGPQNLAPIPLDFTTGWWNEQQGTRGLPSGSLLSLTSTLLIATATATVEATISLPTTGVAFGSCYEDLSGAQLDVGPVLDSGKQYRVRALELAYEATIVTGDGVYLDRGTVAMSLRNEVGVFPSSSFFGYGVELKFTSTLSSVESDFTGFFQPVDNLPMLNMVSAGRAIPVKFSLGGDQGLGIMAAGYPVSTSTTCGATATDVVEETVTAGASSLSYDATSDQYTYVWKTDKAWAGSCRTLTVKLIDGTVHQANFKFVK